MTDAQEIADSLDSARESGPEAVGFSLPVLLFLATGALLFPSSGRDDVYITYWPALSLANDGAISNLNGAAVEQSSSLLDVWLLAALSTLTPLSMPTLGWCLALAAGAGCVVLTTVAARRLGPDYHGAPWLVATATPLVYWSFSGMETSLAALLGLGLVLGWSRFVTDVARRWPGAAVWLVTAGVLTVRPESVFVLACALAGAWLLALRAGAGRAGELGAAAVPRIARLGLVTATIFVALALYRFVTFGSLFPQPAAAKSFTRLGGSGLYRQLLSGFDYLLAQAGSVFHVVLWIGVLGAALMLTRGLRGKAVSAFDVLAGLFCTAYVAFALTTGGDYMEGARYLVPAVPLVLLLGHAMLRRYAPDISRPLLISLVSLQLLGSVDFARHESTGNPLWDRADRGANGAEAASWTELTNRVHLRDQPLIRKLSDLTGRIGSKTGEPVTLISKQMGMVPYYLSLEHPGRVRFIDAYGLATRHVTEPGFAPLRAAWRTDRWAVLWQHSEFLEELWGVSRPDVIYDLGSPPQDLETHGYVVAYRQSGELWARSFLFPGRRVSANAWIAVRADLHAAIESKVSDPGSMLSGTGRAPFAARLR